MNKTLALSLLLVLVFCIPAVSKTDPAGMSSTILSPYFRHRRGTVSRPDSSSIFSTDFGVNPNRVLLQPTEKIIVGGNFSVSGELL